MSGNTIIDPQQVTLSPAQAEEAERRAANAAANVPRTALLYPGLPPVDYQPQQPARCVSQRGPAGLRGIGMWVSTCMRAADDAAPLSARCQPAAALHAAVCCGLGFCKLLPCPSMFSLDV